MAKVTVREIREAHRRDDCLVAEENLHRAKSTPLITRRLADVWRISCQRKLEILASLRISPHQVR
jgi:hypothetical protein